MIARQEKISVLVVGAGGVGTMACVALETSGLAEVTAVLRSNYQHVKDEGFEIQSTDYGNLSGWRPSHIVKSVPEADPDAPFDYIVISMKTVPELSNIPDLIAPAVTPGATSIVLIQNGLDVERPFVERFPNCCIVSCVSMIAVSQNDGIVVHEDHDQMKLGAYHNENLDPEYERERVQTFAAAYGAGKADVYLVDNIVTTRWMKLMWNGVFNPMCAITGLNRADIRKYGGEYSLIRPGIAEMAAIARADGHPIPDNIIEIVTTTTSLDVGFRPSMLVDVDKGNPIEVEVILGTPLRIARKHGVPTPILDNTYRMSKLIQARLMEGKGLTKPPAEVPTTDFL